MNTDVRDCLVGLAKFSAWCFAAGLIGWLSGCTTAPPKVVVRTETVEVSKYIKQPVAPELTAPIVVDEPQATCNDGTGTVFCEDEIKLSRFLLKAAVDQCNRDRKTIRDGQGDKPC